MPQTKTITDPNTFSIQLDLDAAELRMTTQSRQSWQHLRKAVVRNLAAHAHRHAGGWNPSRVELNVPRAWAAVLEGDRNNMCEFNKLCTWLER
jgi:hypothetical protein